MKHIKFVVSMLRLTIKNQLSFFYRKIKTPPMPQNPDRKVLIHLGCGDQNDKRYINVDTRPFSHVHIISSAENPDLFPDNYADLVYACHVLEHFSHRDLAKVLSVWYQWVKPGGVVRLSVPDFDCIIKIYEEYGTCESVINALMGGQQYPGNFHKTIFNELFFKDLLRKAGFKKIEKWYPEKVEDYRFSDWANRKYEYGGKHYDISLNIQGYK